MKSPSRGLDGPAYDNPVDPSGYYPANTMSAARSAIMRVGDIEGAAAAVDHAGGQCAGTVRRHCRPGPEDDGQAVGPVAGAVAAQAVRVLDRAGQTEDTRYTECSLRDQCTYTFFCYQGTARNWRRSATLEKWRVSWHGFCVLARVALIQSRRSDACLYPDGRNK